MPNRRGKVEVVTDLLFLGSWIIVDGDCSHEYRRRLLLGRKAITNLDSVLEKQRHYSSDKGPYSQGYSLTSGHVQVWELDHKEGRAPKNWCLWTVVPEKTLESPLDSKEIKPVNHKGNQSWILTGRTDAEAEATVFHHLMQTGDSLEKSLILRKIGSKRRREHQKMSWLDGIPDTRDVNLCELQEMMKDRAAWHASVHGVTELDLNGWLNNNDVYILDIFFRYL